MAPEIVIAESYDNKVDVFSFGIILTELISCLPPQNRTISNMFAFDQKTFLNSVPFGCPDEMKQLVLDCTQFEPAKRPAFKGDPFFNWVFLQNADCHPLPDIVVRLRKLQQSLPDDD